jgi:hypothetical protein
MWKARICGVENEKSRMRVAFFALRSMTRWYVTGIAAA